MNARPKMHIRRYQLPLTRAWLWGLFRSRTSRRPVRLCARLDLLCLGIEKAGQL